MKILDGDFRDWSVDTEPTAVTVGVYDGIHRGHQEVLRRLATHAPEAPLVVVTFRQHPNTIVAPDRVPPMLMSLEQRLEVLERTGVDIVALLDFDDVLRHLPAREFVTEALLGRLGMRWMAVGEEFRFGYRLEGDVPLLEEMAAEHGFVIEGVPVVRNEISVRSTNIRGLVIAGDVRKAAELIGRPFQLRSVVRRGDRRGHELGFPTANLVIPHGLATPRRGVYAARAGVGAPEHPAVVNIGVRPTFDEGDLELVEVHLLEGGRDVYGEELQVDFIARLRDEQRFPGIEALVAQISQDVADAWAMLS